MSGSTTRSARLGGELNERFEQYKEERDMTVSEAGRALIRRGLEAEERQEDAPQYSFADDFLTSAGAMLAVAAVLSFLFHNLTPLLASRPLVLILAVLTALTNAAAYGARERDWI
jgi:hypothetical protein